MFNKNQLASLNQELDSSRIKTREKGNINLSYIEGFDVIDTANLIFGYGNWSYLISSLTQVSQEQNHNQNFVEKKKKNVKLIVKDENHTKSIFRQDVGFGSGVAKALNDAYENAGKEAVTDGLKRAMRSFGINLEIHYIINQEIIKIMSQIKINKTTNKDNHVKMRM